MSRTTPLGRIHGEQEVSRKRSRAVDLLEYANANRKLFCDVEIRTEKKNIPANKMVLSCTSKFFEKMFKTEMKEKYERVVEIESVDYDSMKAIVDFIYSGKIKITSHNVSALLSTSDYLVIEEVKEFCFDFLLEVLSSVNCFAIMSLLSCYPNVALESSVQNYINENLAEIIFTDDYKLLSKVELVKFVSTLYREEIEEQTVYKAIVDWTNYKQRTRKVDFLELFLQLKLHVMPLEFLKDVVSKEPLVRNDLTCCNLVIDAICNSKKMVSANQESRVVCLGGEKTPTKVFEVFNCLKEPPMKLPDLPENLNFGCSEKLGDLIYYVGGYFPPGKYSSILWSLSFKEKVLKWIKMAPMKEPRSFFGCSVIDETIVTCGGYNPGRLSSAECYSPMWNTWNNSLIGRLNVARSGHVLVTCKGRLFALGGYNDSYLSSVECFKPGIEVWLPVMPMLTPRSRFAAVNCQENIFVIGGTNGRALRSCEKFDFDKKEWSSISNMNFHRSGCAACVLRNKIYVVGGHDMRGEAVKDIECYKPSANQWSVVGRIDEDLYGHSLVTV